MSKRTRGSFSYGCVKSKRVDIAPQLPLDPKQTIILANNLREIEPLSTRGRSMVNLARRIGRSRYSRLFKRDASVGGWVANSKHVDDV